MPQVRHEIEFAQETIERRAAFDDIRHLPEDLEDALLTRAHVFGKEYARRTAHGEAAQAAMAADAHRAETIRRTLFERGA